MFCLLLNQGVFKKKKKKYSYQMQNSCSMNKSITLPQPVSHSTNYEFFYYHHDSDMHKKNAYLSQWYRFAPFEIQGKYYDNAEQYMMSEKAKLFNDNDSYDYIMYDTNDCNDIKRRGREIKNFNQDLWNAKKFNILFKGNLAKFLQNANICNKLLFHTERYIVEASPFDAIYGIGVNVSNAFHVGIWGTNLLGVVLMEVREIIRRKLVQIIRLFLLKYCDKTSMIS
jgi:ribA/ribD-fused uncharacterized protein